MTKSIIPGLLSGLLNFQRKSQRLIAIGMIPRGEYGIIIAQIALSIGVITKQIYTVMIAFIILTIVLTPVLFAINEKI